MATTPITTRDLKILGATNLKKVLSDSTQNTTIYLTLGRVNEWADNETPNVANASVTSTYDVWRNMIGGKKVLASDVSLAIPRKNWVTGTVYPHYDHQTETMLDLDFYVLTSTYRVYKCISNNSGSLSTVEPSSTSGTNISQTSDGYKWKFMYEVSVNDRARFMTDEVVPVKTLTTNDASLQWQAQTGATPGALYHIEVASGGTGYSNVSNLSVSIAGDGVGAAATAGINNISNTVNSITMSAYGAGYTFATVSFSGGGGTGAVAKAIISPPGGHASDPVSELGGSYLIMNPKVAGSENGVISVENEIHQIALVLNPYRLNETNVMTNTAFSQTKDLILSSYGLDYLKDEVVYQGTSLGAASFTGKVLGWDSANLRIRLINTVGTPNAVPLVGANTTASRFVVSTESEPDCEPYTGKILYVENISQIIRSADQTESYKITICF